MASTNYDVTITALFKDRASAQAGALSAGLDKVAHSAGGASHAVWRLAERATEAFAHIGYHALVGFNAEVEQTKIGLAAIIEMNLGGSFQNAQGEANKLFLEFQRFSKMTPVTTKEMTEFGNGVSSAVFAAGGKMADLVNVTEQGVVASKVFGIESKLAQIQLTEMLSGNIRKTERFTMMLLNAGHMTAESFRELTAQQRLDFIKGVINSDAMKEATKAYSESFAGVTSTLKDNVEILLGSVGLPMFKAITEEIKRWNEWIEKNQALLERWGHDFSKSLVDGFHAVKDAVAFIVEHKDAIMALAAAWAMGGVGGVGGKMGGKIGAALKGAGTLGVLGFGASAAMGGDTTQNALTGVLGAAMMLPGPLAAVAAAATAAALGIEALTSWIGRETDARAEAEGKTKFAADLAHSLAQSPLDAADERRMLGRIASANQANGFVTKEGNVDQRALLASLGMTPGSISGADGRKALEGQESVVRMLSKGMTASDVFGVRTGAVKGERPEVQRALELIAMSIMANEPARKELVKKELDAFEVFKRLMIEGNVVDANVFGPMAEKPKVNITIQHLEIQSEDPDRVMFQITEAARDSIKNAGAARGVRREG